MLVLDDLSAEDPLEDFTFKDPYVPWEWYPNPAQTHMRNMHDGREIPIPEHLARFAPIDMSLNRRQRKALQVLRQCAMAAHTFGEIQPQLERLTKVLVRDDQKYSLRELLDKAIDKCRI